MTTLRSGRAGRQGPRALIAASVLAFVLAGASASFAGPTVGVIVPKGTGFGKEIKEKFEERLKEAGVDAKVHVQTPGCDKVSRTNAVRKLLAYEMDAIVVFGTCAAQDAADASKKIPVLLLAGYDPTGGRGERPEWMGSNVAAVACRTSVPFLFDNMEKTLELDSVGVLQCTDSQDSTAQLKEIKATARSRDVSVLVADSRKETVDQMKHTFAKAQFVFLGWECDPETMGLDLTLLGKPVVSQSPGVSAPGIVFTLAANEDAMLEDGANLLSRIMNKRERPGSIPITDCHKSDFAVNLQEALTLGLKIPFEVLSSNM